MASEEQDMEVDRQVSTGGAIQARAARMSLRPPARFLPNVRLGVMAKEIRALYAACRNPNGTVGGGASFLIGG